MPFFRIFYAACSLTIFLILGLYFFHPIPLDITNSDLGMHLTFGKVIVETGSVPRINLLSYTNPTYPFINTHWLSEVLFYLVYLLGGFNALIIVSVLLALSTFFLLFRQALTKFDSLTVLLVSLIALPVLDGRTEVRPELFSYLFLSFFITILYRYKKHYTRWIFLLIPLELLWVNLHIYFFVGIVVLLCFIVDAFIANQKKTLSRELKTLIAVAVGCCVVTLCNPNGVKGAVYPLFVLNNYGFTIEENINFFKAIASPVYNNSPLFVYFSIYVVLLWGGLLLKMKKMPFVDILLTIFFTFLGFFAVRNFSLFILGTFIPMNRALTPLMRSLYTSLHLSKERTLHLIKVLCFIGIFLCILPTIASNLTNNGLGLGITDTSKNAVNFLIDNKIKGPIFNDFDLGNYLVYRLYPQEKVFVYGSPEAFPTDFFQSIYIPMQESQIKFNQEAKRYKLNTVIIDYPNTSIDSVTLIQQLVQNNQWSMVYLDSENVIFLKNTPANQAVITKDTITQKNVTIKESDMDTKVKTGQLTNFFKFVSWDRARADMIIHYLKFDPTNCSAIESTAYLLQKFHDPRLPLYVNKYQQSCGM